MRIASKLAEWLKKRSVDQRGMAGDINGVEQRVEQRSNYVINRNVIWIVILLLHNRLFYHHYSASSQDPENKTTIVRHIITMI